MRGSGLRPNALLLFAAAFLAASLPGWAAGKSGAAAGGRSAPASASGQNGLRASAGLDSAKVHTLYVEGEFDQAIAILEDDLKSGRRFTHDDSVFMYKHLGVMYAAQEATREKGRYYMHRLLMVEPTAKIMDMYASDMIYMIFRNIQEEFAVNHGRRVKPDSAKPTSRPETRREETASLKDDSGKGGKAYLWLGVAAAAMAAGAATWYYYSDEPKVVVHNHEPE